MAAIACFSVLMVRCAKYFPGLLPCSYNLCLVNSSFISSSCLRKLSKVDLSADILCNETGVGKSLCICPLNPVASFMRLTPIKKTDTVQTLCNTNSVHSFLWSRKTSKSVWSCFYSQTPSRWDDSDKTHGRH